jgi:hypothetical protein
MATKKAKPTKRGDGADASLERLAERTRAPGVKLVRTPKSKRPAR